MLRRNRNLTSLDAASCFLKADGAAAIAHALTAGAGSAHTSSSLRNGGPGAGAGAGAGLDSHYGGGAADMPHNSTLLHLNLADNVLLADTGVTFAECLRSNSSLTALNLGGVHRISDDSSAANGTAASTLGPKRAWSSGHGGGFITSSGLGDAGATALAAALAGNGTLSHLWLHTNGIGAPGMRAVSEALPHNAAITVLDLSSNDASGDAGSALVEAVRANESLRTMHVNDTRLTPDQERSIQVRVRYSPVCACFLCPSHSKLPRLLLDAGCRCPAGGPGAEPPA